MASVVSTLTKAAVKLRYCFLFLLLLLNIDTQYLALIISYLKLNIAGDSSDILTKYPWSRDKCASCLWFLLTIVLLHSRRRGGIHDTMTQMAHSFLAHKILNTFQDSLNRCFAFFLIQLNPIAAYQYFRWISNAESRDLIK